MYISRRYILQKSQENRKKLEIFHDRTHPPQRSLWGMEHITG